MCSCACARLLPPLFSPAPSPKPRPAFAHGPTPACSRAVVELAGAASRDDAPAPLSGFDFLELKRELEEEEEAVVAVDAKEGGGAVNEDDGERGAERSAGGTRRRRRRQMARRSALLANQVISVSSARSLGFVSQLWIDAASWAVALVEVRPSLLSGEAEKFLFEDIYQVGDVVLVENESVIDNEHKLVGLHSLVGYNVVTSRRRNVGKVRGFTFDISSGAMESLELDSFGLSIVPSSLVSTYCLFVEDVLDIVSDTIVVHEDAVSRVQRLTQGILGTQNIHGPGGEIDEYSRIGGRRRRANGQGKSGGRELAGERGTRRMTGSCRWTIDTWYRLLSCGSRWRKLAVVAFCLVLILCARVNYVICFSCTYNISGDYEFRKDERAVALSAWSEFGRFGPVG